MLQPFKLNLRRGVHEPPGAQILAYVNRVRDVDCQVDNETFTLADVEANDVRCPDQEAAKAMYKGAQPRTPLYAHVIAVCAHRIRMQSPPVPIRGSSASLRALTPPAPCGSGI